MSSNLRCHQLYNKLLIYNPEVVINIFSVYSTGCITYDCILECFRYHSTRGFTKPKWSLQPSTKQSTTKSTSQSTLLNTFQNILQRLSKFQTQHTSRSITLSTRLSSNLNTLPRVNTYQSTSLRQSTNQYTRLRSTTKHSTAPCTNQNTSPRPISEQRSRTKPNTYPNTYPWLRPASLTRLCAPNLLTTRTTSPTTTRTVKQLQIILCQDHQLVVSRGTLFENNLLWGGRDEPTIYRKYYEIIIYNDIVNMFMLSLLLLFFKL